MRETSSKITLPKVLRGALLTFLVSMAVVPLIRGLIVLPIRASRKVDTNESSAIQSLREIYRAQVVYQRDHPASGFACSLSTLAAAPSNGSPGPQSAQLLDGPLATGKMSGYSFAVDDCTDVNIHNQHTYTDYEATAVPQAFGKTGKRGFCIDQHGEIKVDPAGGEACSVALK